MALVHIMAEGQIAAPAPRVYRIIADYNQHHPNILPPAFSNLQVVSGGVGAGTRITFQLKLAGSTQLAQAEVDEPQPGRVLSERYAGSDMVTTFTVSPEGEQSRVRIETTWTPRGIRGLFERAFAPRMLQPLYEDELQRLERYAQSLANQ